MRGEPDLPYSGCTIREVFLRARGGTAGVVVGYLGAAGLSSHLRGGPLGGGSALIIDMSLQVSVKNASGFAAHERFVGSSLGR